MALRQMVIQDLISFIKHPVGKIDGFTYYTTHLEAFPVTPLVCDVCHEATNVHIFDIEDIPFEGILRHLANRLQVCSSCFSKALEEISK